MHYQGLGNWLCSRAKKSAPAAKYQDKGKKAKAKKVRKRRHALLCPALLVFSGFAKASLRAFCLVRPIKGASLCCSRNDSAWSWLRWQHNLKQPVKLVTKPTNNKKKGARSEVRSFHLTRRFSASSLFLRWVAADDSCLVSAGADAGAGR